MIHGEALRSLREEAGHTQYSLAALVGCRPETISRAERGQAVSADMAERIARALGVSVARLRRHAGNGRRASELREVQRAVAEGPVS
jgi:transcriptional regulator with XRE-family HTH domain